MEKKLPTGDDEPIKDEKLRFLEVCIEIAREDGEYALIIDKFLFEDAISETWEFIYHSLCCNEAFTETFRTRLNRLQDAYMDALCFFQEGDETGKVEKKYFLEWTDHYRNTIGSISYIYQVRRNAIEEIRKLNPIECKS
ncbi:MAG: hypothetical protein LRY73_02150 [Bacillus sp. (in: Bacteria)]|nr:hypothetical protein [Bacillus sp. (in: firmicutes)]